MSRSSHDSALFHYVVDGDGSSILNIDNHDTVEPGDYSTRMQELFDDGDDERGPCANMDEDNEDDGFIYTGVDAPTVPTGYTDQLHDVLGSEFTDEELDSHEIQGTLVHDNDPEDSFIRDHGPSHGANIGDHTATSKSTRPITIDSPGSSAEFKPSRTFLPPNISRLRSFTPQLSGPGSNGSVESTRLTSTSQVNEEISPSPSRLSSMSLQSSQSNMHSVNGRAGGPLEHKTVVERDVFKWTKLSNITEHMYNSLTQKLSSVLGAPMIGVPTVLAAKGLICIGSDQGKICVYDFKQRLKCVCSNDTHGKTIGAVTAIALSHDHTYIASGHASGHIQLFDLKHPKVPVRFVPPTTLEAVASGRKEGHIEGSRIISIDFIAGRHTAIVTADEHGLAFAHSLGKMLFVEAPDILRILGQYQLDNRPQPTSSKNPSSIPDTSLPRRRKTRHVILATAPLPLGTSTHATDQYNVIAMLTPSKLVVVGLKPTPRTWFKCSRDAEEGFSSEPMPRARGALAWRPSAAPEMLQPYFDDDLPLKDYSKLSTTPMLVFTWGCALRLIQVDEHRSKEMTRNPRTGKQIEMDVGRIVHRNAGRWSADENILAVQWLNMHQIAILTTQNLQVLDISQLEVIESVGFDGLSLVSPSPASTVNGVVSYSDSLRDVSHSMRVYQGKIFLLCRTEIRVGTLLTWADRILTFVEEGDFLSAIDLTRLYYIGVAPGNRNGLPNDAILRKEVIGGKMKDLMVASANYAFSEDRMTDGTHVTSDGRGVDRTDLFEGLVSVSCRASIALDDYEFLFEDLFQRFDDTCISNIFVRQLEPFVLNNDIHHIPPRITQRLVALHEEDNRPDHIENIIWHIDPACLDLHHTIRLCQRYHLYDALIYVYARALGDFVAPLVDLLGLIRQVQQFRRLKYEATDPRETGPDDDMESIILNAYKIYPYLSNTLSGLSYPSEEPLPEDHAVRARQEVYGFLFFGRSTVWPSGSGDGSRLIFTADEEGGAEPTYPYVRQLLRFDAESFLHSLDIAFEDSFLNDESQGTNRLIIVRILLEIQAAGDLSSSESGFVNIFIARNVPKYPQFLPIPPSALHNIIVGLAEDSDPATREDRQLAAEYLLSTYNPHDTEQIINLFESAGFYRILRSWHRHEHRWGPLLSAYLEDPELRPLEVLSSVDEVLNANSHSNKSSISSDLRSSLSAALPKLLRYDLADTALLLDKYCPDLHERALHDLVDDHLRFIYLRRLLGPPEQNDETILTCNGPSQNLPGHLRQLYISLQCQHHPGGVIQALRYLPMEIVDWDAALLTCETEEVYDAVIWATNQRGDPQEALRKIEAYQKHLTQRIVVSILDKSGDRVAQDTRRDVQSLVSISSIGIDICLQHSKIRSQNDLPLEDIWFQLLSGTIRSVQSLSFSQPGPSETFHNHNDILVTLRALVQRTFASLVSVTTTQAVSFPRLFTRLVDSGPQSMHAQYTEFRAILTGMLESYRSEGDMLAITKHLVDRDLFNTSAEIVQARDRGWSPFHTTCTRCQKPIFPHSLFSQRGIDHPPPTEIMVFRTGLTYHITCSP